MCGNGIYTKRVTLNTKHLNIPLNKALAIRPINVKWKKRLGKNAVSLWILPEECVLRCSHMFKA